MSERNTGRPTDTDTDIRVLVAEDAPQINYFVEADDVQRFESTYNDDVTFPVEAIPLYFSSRPDTTLPVAQSLEGTYVLAGVVSRSDITLMPQFDREYPLAAEIVPVEPTRIAVEPTAELVTKVVRLREGGIPGRNARAIDRFIEDISILMPEVTNEQMIAAEVKAHDVRRNPNNADKYRSTEAIERAEKRREMGYDPAIEDAIGDRYRYAITHLVAGMDTPEEPKTKREFVTKFITGENGALTLHLPTQKELLEYTESDETDAPEILTLGLLAGKVAALRRILSSEHIDAHPALRTQAEAMRQILENKIITIINSDAHRGAEAELRHRKHAKLLKQWSQETSRGRMENIRERFIRAWQAIKANKASTGVLGAEGFGMLAASVGGGIGFIKVGDQMQRVIYRNAVDAAQVLDNGPIVPEGPPIEPPVDPSEPEKNPIIDRLLDREARPQERGSYFPLIQVPLGEIGAVPAANPREYIQSRGGERYQDFEDQARADGYRIMMQEGYTNINELRLDMGWATNSEGNTSVAFFHTHINPDTLKPDVLFFPDGLGGFFKVPVDARLVEAGFDFIPIAFEENGFTRITIAAVDSEGFIQGLASDSLLEGGDLNFVAPGVNVVDIEDGSLSVPLGDEAQVIAETLNVRNGPSTDAEILAKVNAGDMMVVIGITADGKWFQVFYNGEIAYVAATFVDGSELVGISEATPTPNTIQNVAFQEAHMDTMNFNLPFPGESAGVGSEVSGGVNEIRTTVDYISLDGSETMFYGHIYSSGELASLKQERNDQTLTEAMSFTLGDGTRVLLTTNIPGYHFDGVDLTQFEQDLQTLGFNSPDGKTVVIEFRDIALKDSEDHGQHFQGIDNDGPAIYFMRGEDFETERRYRLYIRPSWVGYYVATSTDDGRIRIAEGYEDSEVTLEIYGLLLSDQMQKSPTENIMDIVSRRIRPVHQKTRNPRFASRTVAISYTP